MCMLMYGSDTNWPWSHDCVTDDQVWRTCPFVGRMPNARFSQSVIRSGFTRGGSMLSTSATRASSLLTCCSSSTSRVEVLRWRWATTPIRRLVESARLASMAALFCLSGRRESTACSRRTQGERSRQGELRKGQLFTRPDRRSTYRANRRPRWSPTSARSPPPTSPPYPAPPQPPVYWTNRWRPGEVG